MEKILKEKHKFLAISLLSTILFIAGIPMIVLGAVYGIVPVMVAGIIFVAVDFYAMPILWTTYSKRNEYARIVRAVETENLYEVKQIAMQYSMRENAVRQLLTTCFQRGYLHGYLFDGEKITVNFNKPQQEKVLFAKCESCGATFTYPASQTGICPYCDTPIRHD